jgi:GNAT superfamily N-acetyltransferase
VPTGVWLPSPGETPLGNGIVRLDADAVAARSAELGTILVDCVEGGASVSFMGGIGQAEAEGVFKALVAPVRAGDGILLGAFSGSVLRGMIHVVMATPQNQRHRAEFSKLMVHRAARWRGLGRALILAAEDEARGGGKSLITLDTTVGSLAERLFAGLDYRRAGVIPGYALHPGGVPSDAVFFWKPI